MFLTKKGFWKILITAICYLFLGMIFIVLSVFWRPQNSVIMIMGALMCIICPFMVLLGYYAESKGRHVDVANKLIRSKLKPAEFISYYEKLINAPNLIVKKPSFELLYLAVMAYDMLDDREKSLLAADEMIAVAKGSKKLRARLAKVSLMYSYEMTNEAEELYDKLRNERMGLIERSLCDNILKSDRAMAMGDYKTVESYCLKSLNQSFPKLDNCSRLVMNFKLAEIYRKTNNDAKAQEHYRYCVANGGETAIVRVSAAALSEMYNNKE